MATAAELLNQSLQHTHDLCAASAQELVAIDARIDALQKQIAQASLELAAATRLRGDVAQRHSYLQDHLVAQQKARSPFSGCSDDVLRSIFTSLTGEPDPKWRADLTYVTAGTWNYERARAPLTLAAVSRSWRAAALTSPLIWDYVGVPPLEMAAHRVTLFVAYIDEVLDRSGAAPIDVLFERVHDVSMPAYTHILHGAYANIHRWRRFNFQSGPSFPHLAQFLRGPAPVLEDIFVVQEEETVPAWPHSFSDILTDCSKLRMFASVNAPWGLDTRSRHLPALQSALVRPYSIPAALFWGSFSHARSLGTLCLDINDAATVGVPPECTLPALNDLALLNDALRLAVNHPTLFGLKGLRALTLGWSGSSELTIADLVPFMTQASCAASLIFLALGSLRADELLCLSGSDAIAIAPTLQRLSTLELMHCSMHAVFWEALEGALPELSLLRLEHVAFEPGAVESFLTWTRRRAQHAPGSSDVPPVPLRVRVDDKSGLSKRDRVELGRLVQLVS